MGGEGEIVLLESGDEIVLVGEGGGNVGGALRRAVEGCGGKGW